MNSAHPNLAAALLAAQAEMPAVDKDSTNSHFKSRFTSLDHLIAKTRPVLTKHGLVITQSPTHLDGQPALATSILHEGGEIRTDVMPLLVGKNDMQGLGSAITYGKRYMWAALLGISADEDDDGESSAAQAERSEPAALTAGSSTERPGVVAGSLDTAPATPGTYRLTFGKHKGLTLAEVPGGYLDWLSENSTTPEVRTAIELYRAEQEGAMPLPATTEDDIPFAPTVDGPWA